MVVESDRLRRQCGIASNSQRTPAPSTLQHCQMKHGQKPERRSHTANAPEPLLELVLMEPKLLLLPLRTPSGVAPPK